jgi:uncharacterized SAM-binding protein YcdF (DUF218 family)
MNDIFLSLGLEAWKSYVAALLLPPLPFLVCVLAGARLIFRRRLLAWVLVLLGTGGVWLSSTEAAGEALAFWLLPPTRALTDTERAELRHAPKTAIVVLGGGRRLLAPEYGVSTLVPRTIERLRYGLWLGRETGLPVAFSGGLAPGAPDGPSEAEIAGRIAEREFGRSLRWLEGSSRDTRENAIKTVALLQPQGIEQIVLVTHDYHMARALANFQRAGASAGARLRIVAAPLGLPSGGRLRVADWLPSAEGYDRTRLVLHEWLGRITGA